MEGKLVMPSDDEVRAMSYEHLRKLAKSLGLRANLKKATIIRNVINHTSNDYTHDRELKPVEAQTVKNDEAKTVPEIVAKPRHIRRRTFDKEEAEMGALTPNITFKREAFVRSEEPSHSKRKCILAPQRIPKKTTEDATKIPRPGRVMKESSITKKSARSTPNFARIHKKIFEQMDTLEDYVVKKQARALKLQERKPDVKSNKFPANGLTPLRTPAKSAISALAPVLALKDVNFNFAQLSTKSAAKKPIQSLKDFKFTQNSKTNAVTNPSQVVKQLSFNFDQKSNHTAKTTTFDNNSKSRKMQSTKSRIPVRQQNSNFPRERENKPTHQQLYKSNNRNREKLVTKQREYIKGVRSNRRFELQMKARKIV